MAMAELLQTGRVAAEVTVARLLEAGVDAYVSEEPNVFVKVTSGGNYRVQVVVPEEELERARAVLVLWDERARPRIDRMARELRLGFFLGSLPALALLLWLLVRSDKDTGLWIAVAPAWLAGLMGWALWSRRRRSRARSAVGQERPAQGTTLLGP